MLCLCDAMLCLHYAMIYLYYAMLCLYYAMICLHYVMICLLNAMICLHYVMICLRYASGVVWNCTSPQQNASARCTLSAGHITIFINSTDHVGWQTVSSDGVLCYNSARDYDTYYNTTTHYHPTSGHHVTNTTNHVTCRRTNANVIHVTFSVSTNATNSCSHTIHNVSCTNIGHNINVTCTNTGHNVTCIHITGKDLLSNSSKHVTCVNITDHFSAVDVSHHNICIYSGNSCIALKLTTYHKLTKDGPFLSGNMTGSLYVCMLTPATSINTTRSDYTMAKVEQKLQTRQYNTYRLAEASKSPSRYLKYPYNWYFKSHRLTSNSDFKPTRETIHKLSKIIRRVGKDKEKPVQQLKTKQHAHQHFQNLEKQQQQSFHKQQHQKGHLQQQLQYLKLSEQLQKDVQATSRPLQPPLLHLLHRSKRNVAITSARVVPRPMNVSYIPMCGPVVQVAELVDKEPYYKDKGNVRSSTLLTCARLNAVHHRCHCHHIFFMLSSSSVSKSCCSHCHQLAGVVIVIVIVVVITITMTTTIMIVIIIFVDVIFIIIIIIIIIIITVIDLCFCLGNLLMPQGRLTVQEWN